VAASAIYSKPATPRSRYASQGRNTDDGVVQPPTADEEVLER
jgi:hypothetical protein